MERLGSRSPVVLASHAGTHLVVHLAWETHAERSLVCEDGSLAAALRAAARELACVVLAAGHTDREVHALVRYPPTLCVSELVERLKEVSAAAWRGAAEAPDVGEQRLRRAQLRPVARQARAAWIGPPARASLRACFVS